jgi:hypothetical protein
MNIRYTAIPAARLDAMREAGHDEFDNKWQLRVAEGWEPLRCCLRKAKPGEDIALICYTPWPEPSPWMEAGPVFVHHETCPGYTSTDEYPSYPRHSRMILNPFDHTGARAYDHITLVGPEDDHPQAIHDVLSQPDVAYLHLRSGAAGCYHFLATTTG